MKFLTEAELKKLNEKDQLEALRDLIDALNIRIDIQEGADLVEVYLEHVPKIEKGKIQITTLESVVFKDNGERRTVLKDTTVVVGEAVGQQLIKEGLAK